MKPPTGKDWIIITMMADSWNFYSVSGGGIVADRTIVVPLNENVD